MTVDTSSHRLSTISGPAGRSWCCLSLLVDECSIMLVSAGLLSVYFWVSDREKTIMFPPNTSLVQELSQIKDPDSV